MVFYKFYRIQLVKSRLSVQFYVLFLYIALLIKSNDTNSIFSVFTGKINYKVNSVASIRVMKESIRTYMLISIYFRSHTLHIKVNSKGLFTPSESEKDKRTSQKHQRINGKHQKNCSLSHSLSFCLNTA